MNPARTAPSLRRRPFDASLYLVTDRALCHGRPLVEVVQAAVSGGVTLVQLREKALETRPFLELARALRAALQATGVPLIINDRVDVALAAGADGVHVGQDDMPVADARRLLGPDAIIGLSVTTPAEAAAMDPALVDYAAVSPVFATPTKITERVAPPEDWARIRALVDRPLLAIGGIHAGNAGRLRAAGFDGIAVVSALCAAEDPRQAAAILRQRFMMGEETPRFTLDGPA